MVNRAFTSGRASLLAALEADAEQHLAFLQGLIRSPSPNPPGDTRAAAAYVQEYLHARHIHSLVLSSDPSAPNVVTEFTCGDPCGPRLVLNGHLDAFPVDPADLPRWDRDPYSGDLDPLTQGASRKIYGRGVVDMKAGTAASVVVFTYLYARRVHLRGSVALCTVSDEETGGKLGSKWLLEQDRERWGGDCMLSGEPGGLGTIRFAEKGTLRATVTVQTRGGHGAYLHLSKGAVRIAAALIGDVVQAVEGLRGELPPGLEEYMQRDDVRNAVDEAMGSGAADLVLRPTLNVGVISGGVKVNMIPETCRLEIDIRYPIGLSRGEVMAAIQQVLGNYPGASIEVQEAASNPPNYCAFDNPMVELLASNAELFTAERKRPVAVPSIGATDCKHYRYAGIPAYVLGPSPNTMAQVNECMDVDEFLVTIKTHAATAWEYLGGPP